MNAMPAVFLDRDGVLSEEQGYVTSIDEFHVFEYSKDCVARLHNIGYAVIVITNQAGIAKGLVSEKTVAVIHEYLIREIGVDAVYCCPHYPPMEGESEAPPYRIRCNCRKPHIGMIERACEDLIIDLRHSWFVGDRASDIETGINAGIRTVLVETGYGTKKLEKTVTPDFVFDSLKEFVDYLEKEL